LGYGAHALAALCAINSKGGANMIAVIATARAKEGKVAELIEDFHMYSAWVKANEPGTMVYTLNATDDPNVFKALEIYKDQAALDAHLANFGKNQAMLRDVMANPPAFEMMKFQAGVARDF
jgi:quinol monooxygenase YgiN